MISENAVQLIHERLANIEHCLIDLKNQRKINPVPETDQFLNIKQASELLNLSVPTLYGYSQRHEIPVSRRAGRLYFLRHDLIEWVNKGRKINSADATKLIDHVLLSKKERGQKA